MLAQARRRRPRHADARPWHIKSTTKAADGLYVYDTVQRLNDSRFGTGDVPDISRYIKLGPLGRGVRRRASATCC